MNPTQVVERYWSTSKPAREYTRMLVRSLKESSYRLTVVGLKRITSSTARRRFTSTFPDEAYKYIQSPLFISWVREYHTVATSTIIDTPNRARILPY